jgi:outer membrane receptor for ferrienterochelin and colicin
MNLNQFKAILSLRFWKIQSILITIFLLLLSTPLYSQDDKKTTFDELYKMSIEELMNIEIFSASKKSEKIIEAPANVTVITSEEIKKKGYLTLLDILRDVPMIDINSPGQGYFTDIGARGVNLRATMGKHWQMLIDGHDMGWHQFYRNHLSAAWLTVDNIDRIEIVKGPASALWGANAYLGVINIITKGNSGSDTGFLSATGGGNSTYSLNGTFIGKFGNDGSIYSTISIFHDNIPRKIKEWSEIKGEDVILKGSSSHFFNSYTKIAYGDFYAKAMISEDKSRHPISSFSVGADDSRFFLNKYWVDAGWKHSFGDGYEIDISSYYDMMGWDDDAHYEDNPYNGPLVIDTGDPDSKEHYLRDIAAKDDVYGARILSTNKLTSSLSLVLGSEYKYINSIRWHFPKVWEHDSLETPEFTTNEYNVYTQLTFVPISSVRILGGIRYDYHEIYKEVFTPRLSAVFVPSDNFIIKAMYGRAYKAPSLHELYYFRKDAVYGNPLLEPEYNNTLETQIIYFLSKNLQFSATAFFIDMRNIIGYQTRDLSLPLLGENSFPQSQRPSGTKNYRQQANHGHYVSRGVEARIDFQPINNLRLSLDGTYRKPIDKLNNNEELNYAAKYKLFFNIVYTLMDKYTLSVSGKYLSSKKLPEHIFVEPGYPYSPSEDISQEAPAYFISNLSLTAQNIVEKVDIILVIDNITNKEYYDAGRNVLFHQTGISAYTKIIFHL